MKKLLFVFSIVTILIACKSKDSKKDTGDNKPVADTTLITDSSWGLISLNTDIDALKRDFGAANLLDTSICGPECADTIAVTIVYPHSSKEMVVYWGDSLYHKIVDAVETDQQSSPYHTADGIKIGSTLSSIQKARGGRLTFSGFGWDYGGYITSFADTALGKSQLGVRMDIAEHPGSDSLYGDRELNTDMPVVKKNIDKIVVTELRLSFFRPL